MKREELRAYAIPGVRLQLRAIEQRLAAYHEEFPEVFISKTPPVLVKADAKEANDWPALRITPATHGNGNGNGHQRSTVNASAGAKRGWTTARRAKQKRTLRRKRLATRAATRAKAAAPVKTKTARTVKRSAGGYAQAHREAQVQNMHRDRVDRVLQQMRDNGPMRLRDIAPLLGMDQPGAHSFIRVRRDRFGWFAKVKPGLYDVGPKAPAAGE